jgi:hypothetical protein
MRTYKIILDVESERERIIIEQYIRHALDLIKINGISVKEEKKDDIS